jgi:hypothetical protein
MACFIISYDLPAGGDYADLIAAIKAYGRWAHITKSTWAVVTEAGAPEVRDHLDAYIPAGGRIFVVKSGREAAWRNCMCSDEWLKARI